MPQSGEFGRLLPGVIYEMTPDGATPRGSSIATLPGIVARRDGDRGGLDLVGFGLGPGAEPVPGYHLVARIGRGKAGEVWKATGPGGFPVALKFVEVGLREAADERNSLSLMRDIRHANLLTIFGTWEIDKYLVVGMDLADGTLEGRHVEAVRRGGPGIPFRELATYLEQAARGLDFLNQPHHHPNGRHDLGLLHRDIKPQNLLLVGGSVKVGDFGLVAAPGQPAGACGSGSLAPTHVPPEWAQGRLCRQSDQYALAMTYCRLGVGCLPSRRDPDGRDELDLSTLPEAQRPVLARALASDPEDRWPDCLTFARELIRVVSPGSDRVVDSAEFDLDLTTLPARPRRPALSSRAWSRVAVAGALTLLVLGTRQPPPEEPDRGSQGPAPAFEPAHAAVIPEVDRPEATSAREDEASFEVVAEPPSTPVIAEAVATTSAMAAPWKSSIRRALESLRVLDAFLERARLAARGSMDADLGPSRAPVPVEVVTDETPVAGPTEPPSDPAPVAPAIPGVPGLLPPRVVVAQGWKVIESTFPFDYLRKAKGAEADLKAMIRKMAEAVEAARPRTSTITVLLPSAEGELVVRGDVGKGHPDEWYGPKRVIHTPPMAEAKDYLVGSFWTDQAGRPQTRSTELKVRPGRSYEVDLRALVPTSREIARPSTRPGMAERSTP